VQIRNVEVSLDLQSMLSPQSKPPVPIKTWRWRGYRNDGTLSIIQKRLYTYWQGLVVLYWIGITVPRGLPDFRRPIEKMCLLEFNLRSDVGAKIQRFAMHRQAVGFCLGKLLKERNEEFLCTLVHSDGSMNPAVNLYDGLSC